MRFARQCSNKVLSMRVSVFLVHLRSNISFTVLCTQDNSLRTRIIGNALAVLILSTCAFLPQSVTGNPLARTCTNSLWDWHNKGTGTNSYRRWIDPEFNSVERNIIEEALRIAVSRLQQKRNWEQIQERYSYAWVTSGSVSWSGVCDEPDVRRNLLFHQLYWLSLPNSNNDTSPAFPDIYIRKGYEKSPRGQIGWIASAPYDTVRIYWDGESWRATRDSKFEITVNNYFLAGPDVYSDPEYWAGTIAHEMMHNLGHRHPDIDDPDYKRYQINVVDEVIQNNGYDYKGSRPTLLSLHACGK
jgi:hypothetical protein